MKVHPLDWPMCDWPSASTYASVYLSGEAARLVERPEPPADAKETADKICQDSKKVTEVTAAAHCGTATEREKFMRTLKKANARQATKAYAENNSSTSDNRGSLINIIAVLALIAMAAPLSTGCATTKATQKSELETLRQQNAAMQRQLAAFKRHQQASRASHYRMAPRRPMTVMPRADMAYRVANHPQEWGFMHKTAIICKGTPFHVTFINSTPYHVTALLDGKPVKVFGGQGILPTLPPGQRIEFCLQNIDTRHTVAGKAYAGRKPYLREIGTYGTGFNDQPGPYGKTLNLERQQVCLGCK